MPEEPTRRERIVKGPVTFARGPEQAGDPTRAQRKLAKRVVEKHWRGDWTFDATGLTVRYSDGLVLRFEGI